MHKKFPQNAGNPGRHQKFPQNAKKSQVNTKNARKFQINTQKNCPRNTRRLQVNAQKYLHYIKKTPIMPEDSR
jgi:hypothetical protein